MRFALSSPQPAEEKEEAALGWGAGAPAPLCLPLPGGSDLGIVGRLGPRGLGRHGPGRTRLETGWLWRWRGGGCEAERLAGWLKRMEGSFPSGAALLGWVVAR